MSFTPLHVYSGYSFLKSGIKLDEYVKQGKVLGYSSLGLTDLENLTAAPQFVSLCKTKSIKPIIGMDLYIENNLLTFIPKNEIGYSNLLKISFASQKGVASLDFVKQNEEGLIVIISTKNEIFKEIKDEGFTRKLAKLSRGLTNFYIGLDKGNKLELDEIRDFSYTHGYSLLAFPTILYLKKEDAITLKMLQAVENKEVLTEKKATGDEYLLDIDAIKSIYTDEEINLTDELANSISFEFVSKRGKLIKYENDLGLNSDDYLHKAAHDGLKKLNLDDDIHNKRLDYELSVIKEMKYSDYFLVVKDFIDFARSKNIYVGPGRGSAVGSLVAYTLGITQNDPIKYNLIFERFLNKERQTLPDIDVDFEDTRREEIVEYLRHRYGNNRVAKVIAIQKFGAKQALNDVGRVFGYEKRDIELFTKLIRKDDEKLSLRDLYRQNKEFRNLVNEDKYYLEIVALASKLDGLPRQSGLHAAGVVINAEPLELDAPITISGDGTFIEQFEKDYLEDQNFLKMDLLSLRNLTIVKDCINRIKESQGISLDIDSLPYDDKKAISLIRSGKTMGLFQIESAGMRKSIKTLKPTEFEDIVALISLYRPGPMENIEEYALRKQGKKKFSYLSPILKDILSPTYGIIIYQEQVMQIASKMASFSMGEADLLRRAISKKNSAKLASYEKKFIEGAIKNGYKENEAKDVYKLIYRFGDYGFNRSHALGYAVLTCRMAYLKAYYPREFFASVLSSSNSENFLTTVAEIKNLKLKLVNPDINISTREYLLKDDKIIFPITSIKGISSLIANDILFEREEKPFEDFFDFVVRMSKYKINGKTIMSLIDAGAFDNLEKSRASLRINIPSALNYASMIASPEDGMILDMSMFPKPSLARMEDNQLENLNKEFDALNLMLSGSPLQISKNKIKDIALTSIFEIENSNGSINIAAIIRNVKAIKTKNGKPMAFATIYDDSGETEITIFANAYEISSTALKKGNVVIIKGYYSSKREELVVDQILKLEEIING